jgi:hypothetical protein
VFALPLSKGADLHVTFEYEAMVVDENGDPVLTAGQPQYVRADYPAGATVTLAITNATVPTNRMLAGAVARYGDDGPDTYPNPVGLYGLIIKPHT